MASVIQSNFRIRKNFARIAEAVEIPNLIDIQKRSYDMFLQTDVPPDDREDVGLQAVFKSVFPIKDFNETCSLEFVEYRLERPKYDVEECMARGMTFAAPIKVVIRLVVWDTNDTTGVRSIRDVKEQEVFFGEIPLMTSNGTFIVNGTERVIVSQLHRSPGAFFDHDKGKKHSSWKVALLGADHPVSRLVDRLRVRCQGHPSRPDRPSTQAAGDGSSCARSTRSRRIRTTVRTTSIGPATRPKRSSRCCYDTEVMEIESIAPNEASTGDLDKWNVMAWKRLDKTLHVDTVASMEVVDPDLR